MKCTAVTVSYFRGHVDNILMILTEKKVLREYCSDNITNMHTQYFSRNKMFYLFYFMAFKGQNSLAFFPHDTFIYFSWVRLESYCVWTFLDVPNFWYIPSVRKFRFLAFFNVTILLFMSFKSFREIKTYGHLQNLAEIRLFSTSLWSPPKSEPQNLFMTRTT